MESARVELDVLTNDVGVGRSILAGQLRVEENKSRKYKEVHRFHTCESRHFQTPVKMVFIFILINFLF